jgi:hypothetical protein
MPKIDSHVHGHPSWADLATTDQAAAKSFYGGLFGWTYEDNAMPETDEVYSMAQLNGEYAGAIFNQAPEQTAAGIPSMWTTYLAVDDADAAFAKVTAAGGTPIMEPFDVMNAGRMALVQDPSGGVAGLWQGKDHHGRGVEAEAGSVIWNELQSTDANAASSFFTALLGWDVSKAEMDMGMDYRTVKIGDDDAAVGILQMTEDWDGMPTHWATYFAIDDCDASVEKAVSLGGSVLVPANDIPSGRFAVLFDPQGAAFCIITMAPME